MNVALVVTTDTVVAVSVVVVTSDIGSLLVEPRQEAAGQTSSG